MMSSEIDSCDVDQPSETDKVENVGEESDCTQDPTAGLLKPIDSGVVPQDQPAEVDKQDLDQYGARDVEVSRSSHLEDTSNDCGLEQNAPMQHQEFAEVADQNIHQNKDDVDSRPAANGGDKSNDRELERDTPMESEDNYSGKLYDYLILNLFFLK